MVMGGYDENNDGQSQTYILSVGNNGALIRDINVYPLPFPEGFWNNTPIIYDKVVFALQNISTEED